MANSQTHLRQAILFVFSCQTSKERWYVNIPLRKFSCPSACSRHYVSCCPSYKQAKSSLSLKVFIYCLFRGRFYCFIWLCSFYTPYFSQPLSFYYYSCLVCRLFCTSNKRYILTGIYFKDFLLKSSFKPF